MDAADLAGSGSYATLLLVLDLVGVFVFALSGALLAVRRGLDLVGVLVLAWVAGLGGGTLRDLLLGLTPPAGVSDGRLVAAALLAGLAVFALYGSWRELARRHPDVRWGRASFVVRLLDAVGLGVFAVNGALIALSVGAGPLTSTIVGGVTATGGGLLRDLLVGRVPEVLCRELYALPALVGAGLVVLADHLGVVSAPVVLACAALVTVVRLVAVALDLNAPRALRTDADLRWPGQAG